MKEGKKGGKSLIFGLATCFSLGTFTDNFFKQATVLLAASLFLQSKQGIATLLYSLPYIFFSAWAGWVADHYSKKNIVIIAKFIELMALLLGAFSLYYIWWSGILLTIFIMGIQATLFSPAINGSIPENFSAEAVPKINSLVKVSSTLAVLGGITLSGLAMDVTPGVLPRPTAVTDEAYGRFFTGCVVVIVAIGGFLIACFLKGRHVKRKAKSPFPWLGPVASMKYFLATRSDPQLFTVLLAEGFFYGVVAVSVLNVANLSVDLHFSKTIASLLSSTIMVGVAIGAIFSGRSSAESWKKYLFPSMLGMSAFLVLAVFTPMLPSSLTQLVWFFIVLLFFGVCGGIYLIPLASFIQVRPAEEDKGKIIGVSNFFSFIAIGLWGVVFIIVMQLGLPTEVLFAIYSCIILLFATLFIRRQIRSFI